MKRIIFIMLIASALSACKFGESETAKTSTEASSSAKQEENILEHKNGRFQIVISNSAPGPFTFLLDTQTGRTWRILIHNYLKGQPAAWVPMNTIDDFQEIPGSWTRENFDTAYHK